MADEFDFDDDDLFADLDMDSDSDDNPDIDPDDRNPVDTAKAAALDSLTDRDNQMQYARTLARNALPEGYKVAFDEIDNVAQEASSIYDDAVDELEKPIRDFKKVIHNNAEALPDFLGETVKSKIKALTATEEDYTEQGKFDADQANIESALKDIFERQSTQQSAADEAQTEMARASLDVQIKGNETTTELQRQMAVQLSRQTEYQDSVLIDYQRKSLELQHRQYFVTRDFLSEYKAGTKDLISNLEAITKNTALPEFQKIRLSEGFTQTSLQKIYGDVGENFTDFVSGFAGKTFENLRDRAKDFIGDVREGIEMATDISSTFLDDEDVDVAQMAGSMTGEFIGTQIGSQIGKFVRRRLEDRPGVRASSARVQFIVENFPTLIREYLQGEANILDDLLSEEESEKLRKGQASIGEIVGKKSEALEEKGLGFIPNSLRSIGGAIGSVTGSVAGFAGEQLLDSLPDFERADLRIKARGIDTGMEPVALDESMRSSWVEVIPGYLSRMLQQLTEINTGTKQERLVFSRETSSFEYVTDVAERVRKELITDERERQLGVLDGLLGNYIGGTELSVPAKEALLEELLQTVGSGRTFRSELYTDPDAFADPVIGKEIADVMSSPKVSLSGKILDKVELEDAKSLAGIKTEEELEAERQEKIEKVKAELKAEGIDPKSKEGRERIKAVRGNELYAGMGKSFDRLKERFFPNRSADEAADLIVEETERSELRAAREARELLSATKSLTESINRRTAAGESEILRMAGIAGENDELLRSAPVGSPQEPVRASVRDTLPQPVQMDMPDFSELTEQMRASISGIDLSGVTSRLDRVLDSQIVVGNWEDIKRGYVSVNDRDGLPVHVLSQPDLPPALEPLPESPTDPNLWRMQSDDIVAAIDAGFMGTQELLSVIAAKESVAMGYDPQTAEAESKGLLGKARSAAGSAISFAGKGLKAYYAGLWKTGKSVFTAGRSLASTAIDTVTQKYNDTMPKDWYRPGDPFPAIRKELLRAGQYIDESTGKAIKSIKDIKGNVLDRAGNLVATREELEDGLQSQDGESSIGKYILKPIGSVIGMYGNLGNASIDFAKRVGREIIDRKDNVKDMYVKGELEPAIRASLLRGGHYVSETTGRTIKSLKDIDGRILDKDGNVVLGIPELKDGLVDRFGKDISFDAAKSNLEKAVGFAADAVTGLASTGKSILLSQVELSRDIISGGVGAVKDMASGFKNRMANKSMGVGLGTGDRLDDIYNYMRTRWPLPEGMDIPANDETPDPLVYSPEPAKMGDLEMGDMDAVDPTEPAKDPLDRDGDGDRDFGWRDLFQRAKESRQALKERRDKEKEERRARRNPDPDNASEDTSLLLTALGVLGGIFTSGIGTVATGIAGLIPGIAGLLGARSAASTAGDIASGMDLPDSQDGRRDTRGRQQPKPKGRFGRMMGGISRGVGAVADFIGLGGVKDKAVNAVRAGAGFVGRMASAGGGVARAGLGLLARGGVAAAGLAAPLLAPAAAVAGVAYTAYQGYKAYKYIASRTDLEPLEKLRYLQYGVNPNDTDLISAIRYLEDDVIGEISFSGAKPTYSKTVAASVEAYAEGFGIDMSSRPQMIGWATWFAKRFMPIFLKHLSVIRKIDRGVDLLDVDDEIDKSHIVEYVSAVSSTADFRVNNDDPLTVRNTPMIGHTISDNKEAIAKLVKSLIGANPIIHKEGKDDGDIEMGPDIKPYEERVTKESGVTEAGKAYYREKTEYFNRKGEQLVKSADGAYKLAKTVAQEKEIKAAGSIELIMPCPGKVTSPFGMRVHPITGVRKMHKGVDIAAPAGTPIVAAAKGTVYRKYYSSSYGRVVYMKHENGMATRYAHMRSFANINVGDTIEQGHPVGTVGNSGRSAGNHLHWELRANTKQEATPLDPLKYVKGDIEKEVAQEEKDARKQSKAGEKESISETLEGQETIASTNATRKQQQLRRLDDMGPDAAPMDASEPKPRRAKSAYKPQTALFTEDPAAQERIRRKRERDAAAEERQNKRVRERQERDNRNALNEQYLEQSKRETEAASQRARMIELLESIDEAMSSRVAAEKQIAKEARSEPRAQPAARNRPVKAVEPVVNMSNQ